MNKLSFIKFKMPGPKPEGIAWDGKTLWIIDRETKLLYNLSKDKKEIIRKFNPSINEPRAITWDGQFLWCIDDKEKTINKISLEEKKIITSFKAPMPKGKGVKSLEGLAWDGNYIWITCYAGWSSTTYQIDPMNGETIQSFFCGCWPKGIATNGKVLWTLCYTMSKRSAKIDRRMISDITKEMKRSRKFVFDLPKISKPKGLVFDGKRLLILDENSKGLFYVEVE
ncbi:MAG: YncE family protein [Candidatus Heimdallarchaeota archaeon]